MNARFPQDHNGKVWLWGNITIGLIAIILCCIIGAMFGSVQISPETILKIILSKLLLTNSEATWSSSQEIIFWQIRLPRVLLAALVGICLSISGSLYQGVFRNPLADPYLIGVASGAGLGATIIFLLDIPIESLSLTLNILPIAAFIGGILAVLIAYTISSLAERPSITTIILSGVAIGAFCTAISSFLYLKSDPDLRPVMSWIMGGFIRATWNQVGLIAIYFIPGVIVSMIYSRVLNAMQVESDHATSLGVNVKKTQRILIITATLLTAAAVSMSGIIGFVGLAAPHIARLVWGADHRILIPMSGLIGGAFLVISDLIARTIISPGELPVGIITAICGTPFFIFLLLKNKREIF